MGTTGVDSVLVLAFGAPERVQDVRPYLRLLLQGRPVSPARTEELARRYELIGGSPFNELTRRQARALEAELARTGPAIPVHFGAVHWHPFVVDTLGRMVEAGERRTTGLVFAPHRCEASWEKYRVAVSEALAALGRPPLEVRYPRAWHDHPGFVEAVADRAAEALARLAARDRDLTTLVFTAHSVPRPMSDRAGYADQVADSARRTAEKLGHPRWTVAWQSRSGRPQDPWLEPDIALHLRDLVRRGVRSVIVVPIGFVCDHEEVLYDLDVEAAGTARELGLMFRRAATVGTHPAFIRMLADLVREA